MQTRSENIFREYHEYLVELEAKARTKKQREAWKKEIEAFMDVLIAVGGDIREDKKYSNQLNKLIKSCYNADPDELRGQAKEYRQYVMAESDKYSLEEGRPEESTVDDEAVALRLKKRVTTKEVIENSIMENKPNPFIEIFNYFKKEDYKKIKHYKEKKHLVIALMILIEAKKPIKQFLLDHNYASKQQLYSYSAKNEASLPGSTSFDSRAYGAEFSLKHTGEFANLISVLKHYNITWLNKKLNEVKDENPFNLFRDIFDHLDKYSKDKKYKNERNVFDHLMNAMGDASKNKQPVKEIVKAQFNDCDKKTIGLKFTWLMSNLTKHSEASLKWYFEKFISSSKEAENNVFLRCQHYLNTQSASTKASKKNEVFKQMLECVGQGSIEEAKRNLNSLLISSGYQPQPDKKKGFFDRGSRLHTGEFATLVNAIGDLTPEALHEQWVAYQTVSSIRANESGSVNEEQQPDPNPPKYKK